MPLFTIYDLEYTTWEGAMQNDWMADGQYKEIVQIGAIRVDSDDFSVRGEFNLLVMPKINPVLSDYCIALTGITQERLENEGVGFQEALDRFLDFANPGVACAYGNDACILAENIALQKVHPRGFYGRTRQIGFVDIGYYINLFAPQSQGSNSGRLWQVFNQPKPHEAHEHDALFDCYSILAALRVLSPRGFVLPLPVTPAEPVSF